MQLSGPIGERHAIKWRPWENGMQLSGANWRAPCNKVTPIGERHALKWRPLENGMQLSGAN